MKPSTACELAGFLLLAVAAWMLDHVAGVAVAGVCLLLVGYAMEDDGAEVALRRPAALIKAWRQRRSARREARRKRRAPAT